MWASGEHTARGLGGIRGGIIAQAACSGAGCTGRRTLPAEAVSMLLVQPFLAAGKKPAAHALHAPFTFIYPGLHTDESKPQGQ